jgi:hypothetical protein
VKRVSKNKKEDIAFQAKAALLPKEATHRFSAEFWIEKPNLHNHRMHFAEKRINRYNLPERQNKFSFIIT